MTSLLMIDDKVRNAWRPPALLKPSEWASDNVVLPRGQTARPGPIDHRNAPYLAGLVDLLTIPGAYQVNIMKAGQIGVSEALRWYLGYLAANQPDPVGLALPDKDKGEAIVKARIVPLFNRTRSLRRLMTSRAHDIKKREISLANGWRLSLMWSGSASSTASDPMRVVINDEVDKFAQWAGTGKEAHAVYRTLTRLRTFEDRAQQVNVSTPTTRLNSMINSLVEASHIVLAWLMPCAKCGIAQRLVFDRLKWGEFTGSREAKAHAVIQGDVACYYQCGACSAQWSDADRKAASLAGRWGTFDSETNLADGKIDDINKLDALPARTHVGVQVSSFACMWIRQQEIAAAGIAAKGDAAKMYSFRTETLGEVFEEQRAKIKTDELSEYAASAELDEGVLPWWSHLVIASIDTQADHFYIVVRAWGPAMLSQRVYHAKLNTFDDLDHVLATVWPVQDQAAPAQRVGLTVIDSGGNKVAGDDDSRTQQVYRWCLRRGDITHAIKGDNSPRPGEPWRRGRGAAVIAGSKHSLGIYLVNSGMCEDMLAGMMSRSSDDSTVEIVDQESGAVEHVRKWSINRRDDHEYNRHLANRVKVSKRVGNAIVGAWSPVGSGARYDYRMCEVYQVAGAYLAGLNLMTDDVGEWKKHRDADIARAASLGKSQHDTSQVETDDIGFTSDGRSYLATER